jgi:hypothetical protein
MQWDRCLNRRAPRHMAAVQRLAGQNSGKRTRALTRSTKAARRIVESADVVGLEELNVRGMTRSA